MSLLDARSIPLDDTSADFLREQGLRYRTINVNNPADADVFSQSVARGFLGARPSNESLERSRGALADRRNIGVFDERLHPGAWPIATVGSWVTPLTVSGGELPMWAISSVTVSGTHRRRGIARAMLEGELRAAAEAGMAVAGLTVSEATLYERYGFGPAVPMARFVVDTRRAGWAGAEPAGRFEHLDRARLATALGGLHEQERRQRAGQIAGWTSRWERSSGLEPGDKTGDAVRGIRYTDADGLVRGAMAYELAEGDADTYTLRVRQLTAVTSEAVAALWHFALHHALVSRVEADLRPLDDPLPWLVTDQRAITQTVRDHGWLRILDLPAFFAAQRAQTDLDVTVALSDPLGFTTGTWALRAEAGDAIEASAHEGDAEIAMSVAALSAASLGGVRLRQLREAGRVTGSAAAASALDRALTPEQAPALSIWY